MGYYRGDGGNYYRGDYYKGDPFLGALAAGVIGKGLKKAAGWVGSRIGRAAGSRPTQIVMDALPGVGVGMGVEAVRNRLAGGTLPALPALPAGGAMIPFMGKKKYRKMNPLNPRALKRAIRRAEGFEKFAKKTVNALYKTVDGRRVRTYKKTTRAS